VFAHLHCHSAYSISDGLFAPKIWVKAIKERGLKAQALTDHGTMAGLLPFYYAMKEEKLTPLMGCEFYFADRPTERGEANRSSAHIILIAKDYDGWQNLLKLSSLSYADGFYYKPRIGIEWMRQHSHGLICLTACLGGVLSREVWRERDEKVCMGVADRFKQLSAIYGSDLYVEFQGHASDDQSFVHRAFLKRLAPLPGFQAVVTNDCHYIDKAHANVQTLVKASAFRNAEAAASYTSFDSLWLKKSGDVLDGFTQNHEYLSRRFVVDAMLKTEEIVEKCKGFEIPKRRYLPTFHTGDGTTSAQLFKELTTTALAAWLRDDEFALRYATKEEYVERFKKEYRVIMKHKLHDYYLIVWDIIQFAKRQKIYTGIGRGSSAGSLIAFLLDITKLNPLQYKLLFERFVNDNRAENGELPDMDLDFESARRGEVKQYVFDRYGTDRVCEIGTYGRMMLKTAIVDFGKQFGFNQRDLLNITTTLGLDKTDAQNLDAAMEASPRLKTMMEDNEEYQFAVRSVNGQLKTQSIHPAGVLISSEPLAAVTPLKTQKTSKVAVKKKKGEEPDRVIVTQAEDKYVIAQGLVKMDLLGLKEYDIFKYVVEHAPTGMTVDNYIDEIHFKELRHPDAAVWEMFKTGRTEAVFQFGSDGMKQLLIDMKADNLADIIAAVALYRPGCLANNWHTRYYSRKHGEEEVDYPHALVEATLGDTFGVPVYQEQFMEIFHLLGGISLVDADLIRSALGKKDEAKLAKFRERFVAGATEHVGAEKAAEIWDQLKQAAGYTFNRSHSAVYGFVAYISQYFKVHHAPWYWAAVIQWNAWKLLVNKRAAAAMGVHPRLPDVNLSGVGFVVRQVERSAKRSAESDFTGEVSEPVYQPVWSLTGIKGIGKKTAEAIVECQPFASIEDFYQRVNGSKVKFPNILSLIYAGAFDSLGDRCDMIRWLYSQKRLKGKKLPSLTPQALLVEYHRAVGFFEQRLRNVFPEISPHCFSEREVIDTCAGEAVLIAGMVSEVRAIKTRKGDMMGRVVLVDADERLDVTFFPDQWKKYRTMLREGAVLQVAGFKSDYGGRQNQVEAEEAERVDEPAA